MYAILLDYIPPYVSLQDQDIEAQPDRETVSLFENLTLKVEALCALTFSTFFAIGGISCFTFKGSLGNRGVVCFNNIDQDTMKFFGIFLMGCSVMAAFAFKNITDQIR